MKLCDNCRFLAAPSPLGGSAARQNAEAVRGRAHGTVHFPVKTGSVV